MGFSGQVSARVLDILKRHRHKVVSHALAPPRQGEARGHRPGARCGGAGAAEGSRDHPRRHGSAAAHAGGDDRADQVPQTPPELGEPVCSTLQDDLRPRWNAGVESGFLPPPLTPPGDGRIVVASHQGDSLESSVATLTPRYSFQMRLGLQASNGTCVHWGRGSGERGEAVLKVPSFSFVFQGLP